MARKKIQKIVPALKVNMGGHLIDQPLPIQGIDAIDPFLLIHHWDGEIPKDRKQQEVGVGPHPHRGFSPVTFVFKGSVHHRDSFGNDEVVEAGGTQWMFAGSGVVHSERPGKELAEKGGQQEIIQFWVNAPADKKMTAPFYKPLSAEETPTLNSEGIELQVVCGNYEGIKGAVDYFVPLQLLRGEIQSGYNLELKLEEGHNTIVYLLDGKLSVNGETAKTKNMVWLGLEGDLVHLEAEADTRFIVLSGEPINEKVNKYGPFVMNNQTEIMEALRDSQIGKMGVLIEEFD